MGDNCEWKDGKFEECEELNNFGNYGWGGSAVYLYRNERSFGINTCPFCSADIRKPEPAEPLIVKSGETWVAHENKIDYLCITPCIAKLDYYHVICALIFKQVTICYKE